MLVLVKKRFKISHSVLQMPSLGLQLAERREDVAVEDTNGLQPAVKEE